MNHDNTINRQINRPIDMTSRIQAVAASIPREIIAKYSTKLPSAAKPSKRRGERGEEDYPELSAAVAEYEQAVRNNTLEWGTLKCIANKHRVATSSILWRFRRNLERLEKQACK